MKNNSNKDKRAEQLVIFEGLAKVNQTSKNLTKIIPAGVSVCEGVSELVNEGSGRKRGAKLVIITLQTEVSSEMLVLNQQSSAALFY